MNIEHLIKTIYIEEGNEEYPYLDSKDIWTISVGFTSVDNVKVHKHTKPLTESQVDKELLSHIWQSRAVVKQYINNYDQLSSVRQMVLINMAYQLRNRLKKFIKTKEYIESRQWKRASYEMLDSVWAKEDSPNRALRMSRMFRTNRYDKFYD